MLPSALSPRVHFRNFTRACVVRDARAWAGAPKQATSESSFKLPPYLNIKLPDLSVPPPEPEVHIPFTPDFWESSRAKADAAPALPEEPQVPKVIVVAGDSARADSTHISAFIREHVTVEHHHAEPASVPKSSNLRTLFIDVADDLMLPKDLNAFKYSRGRLPLHVDFEETSTSTGAEMSKFHNRTLDDDQVRGIWVIAGLFAGSWVAGGLLKKNSKYAESE
ncbi:hypothetical protein F5888DRAFT_986854 [Russula emetica]|nr:hypothetical protein F5888DRAFT_986854 [Russula emetica]